MCRLLSFSVRSFSLSLFQQISSRHLKISSQAFECSQRQTLALSARQFFCSCMRTHTSTGMCQWMPKYNIRVSRECDRHLECLKCSTSSGFDAGSVMPAHTIQHDTQSVWLNSRPTCLRQSMLYLTINRLSFLRFKSFKSSLAPAIVFQVREKTFRKTFW